MIKIVQERKSCGHSRKLSEYFTSVWKSEGAFPVTSESLKQPQTEVPVEDVLE